MVVEDELPDLAGKLVALPLALSARGRLALGLLHGRADGPDRVRRRTQIVGGHMRHATSLTGGVCCFPRGAGQISGGAHSVAAGGAGLHHSDLAPRPRACQFDRSPRTLVARLRLLKIVQHVLGAIRRPQGEKVMVGICKGAAATNCDEPRVTHIAKNHCLLILERLLTRPRPFAPHEAPFWDDPHIGRGMLAAHLDPEREAASRPHARIDREVDWIVRQLGLQPGATVLDVGCGPGLYCTRLARRGLRVTGVDFSATALNYARTQAERDGLSIEYRLADYRALDLVHAFDAALLIYYDFGVLPDGDRDEVLRRVARALRPGGHLVFDVLTPRALGRRAGQREWTVCQSGGFWRPGAYLDLRASYHYPDIDAEVDQHVVIDASGEARVYHIWNRGYTPETLEPVFERNGFQLRSSWGDLEGSAYGSTEALGAIARRQ